MIPDIWEPIMPVGAYPRNSPETPPTNAARHHRGRFSWWAISERKFRNQYLGDTRALGIVECLEPHGAADVGSNEGGVELASCEFRGR